MKVLLDTHYVIWMAIDQVRLSPKDKLLIADPNVEIHVSALSIWEIRIKWNTIGRSGERKGRISPNQALEIATGSGFTLVSLHSEDLLTLLDPPTPHNDPFDEMLLVHAQQLGARLLTRDRQLRRHPLAISL